MTAADVLAMRLQEVARKVKEYSVHQDISQNMENVLLNRVALETLEVQEMVCDAIEEAYTKRVEVELGVFDTYKAVIAQIKGVENVGRR